jgi:glycosyltransferase involved in cell wall biosynthesis
MINEKTISLCMVVWNSSDLAKRAIDSVRSIVDEVIIVDQGSLPEHSSVLKELANTYIKMSNKGNADYDRDYCYSLATKDFILAMDADETISQESVERLKKAMRYDFDIMWFRFVNKVVHGELTIPLEKFLKDDPHPRLWKRVIQKDNVMVPPLKWPQEAHKFPEFLSQKVIYCNCEFEHIRQLGDIIKTHLHRGKNIEKDAQGIEREFVRAVLGEFPMTVKQEMSTTFPELSEYLK